LTKYSVENFGVAKPHVLSGIVTSLPTGGQSAFDGVPSTQFKSTNTNNCYVQVQFENSKIGVLNKVKYFMNRMSNKQVDFVGFLHFQYFDSGLNTWTTAFTADQSLREGWNDHKFDTPLSSNKFRFLATNKKACQIGEIELWGVQVADSTSSSETCAITINSPGSTTQTMSQTVTYSGASTPTVTGISPEYGTYKGGDELTITGTGFSTDISEVSVLIDGYECTVSSATETTIICTTGRRVALPDQKSTVLRFTGASINGYAVMNGHSFTYINYWSDPDTWMGEFAPQDGDSIVIPKGQRLLVDIDMSPMLNAIVVQGELIFEPSTDEAHYREFHAQYIFVDRGAKLQIGTENDRYTSKLTIIMHGKRESPQIPVYGNKGIFVRGGQLDIHGKERNFAWTELGATVMPGSSQIDLITQVDWQAGEMIVIAPTDFEVDHAEVRKITFITTTTNSNGDTVSRITLSEAVQWKHYSGTEEYSSTNTQYPISYDVDTDTITDGTEISGSKTKSITMRAEVGLLTRNVVYKGANDDSIKKRYGAHIMLHSHGDDSLTGRISYVELTQVGQAFQLGRYPIHFHMIGAVHNSYIKGNSIHHTYNRACTIHGVQYLTIANNVAFETMGHTFFIEDGAETKNYLFNNLAIKTKISFSLLNTDQSPASFWITNPDNQFVNNHAAGSENYGFWFDLQEHPTGPSFDPSI
jgi:hypothetical protein